MTQGNEGHAAVQFGLALYRSRLSRGLSLRVLARRLGMSGHGGLAEYEKGRRIPPEDVVLACERVLGLPAGQLRALRDQALAERAAAKVAGRLATPPALTCVAAPAVAQLPADVADFTGRDREMSALRALAGPKVAVLSGKPGVGKTALAVHAGHLLLAEYPDAQLYCDLHGVHAPTDPAEVLATMLRALGVSESQLPSGIEERSALFRSQLHGRKVLLVLDNAADEAQVRPLLPGAAGCLTLVTSRSRLSGLAGAHRVPVGVPGQDAAVELLAEIIGRPRVSDEPEHAVELVRACGLLPLAVRIVGNQLVALPDWTLRYLTTRLADERHRLARLTAGDLAVRGAFAVSLDALSEPGRRLFRLLGLVPGADFEPALAAAIAELDLPEAERVLDELAEASLVEPAPVPGRYRLHDLLRLYATERLHAEQQDEPAARARMVDWLLRTARAAAVLLVPPSQLGPEPPPAFAGDRGAALAWLDAEQDNVLGAAQLAADQRVIDLLGDLVWYLDLRCAWRMQRQLSELALAVAPDLASAALAWNRLGLAHNGMGEYDDALRCHRRAAELARRGGARAELGNAYDKQGVALWGLGRFVEAAEQHQRDIAICRQLGDTWGEAAGLNHLGHAHYRMDHFSDAAECHRQAGELFEKLGDVRGQAMAGNALGRALSGLARFPDARRCHDRALAVFTMVGDRWAAGTARYGLGVALHGLGGTSAALDELWHARAVFQDVRDRMWEAHCLRELGRLLDVDGQQARAVDCWRQALARYRELGSPDADGVCRLLGESVEDPR